MASIIGSITSHNQDAFIPGKQIHSHILLATELIMGYTRKHGTPRCLIQLDLQKAYDMLNWKALETILFELGIPETFVHWIMQGVSSVTYRFSINGDHSNLMQAKRGVRHHSKCGKLGITHLTFADDILLFSRGDKQSIDVMMQAMDTFYSSTRLVVNPMKCYIYFGDVDIDTKQEILASTGFNEDALPFRYLGVPVTSKRLTVNHYLPLIEKILSRINHWSAKLLSIVGRVQLVKAVTTSIANYWL
ncbi:uncharacterized protein LOC131632838 [Vicia villosa]|uniref:uncharacterized protein LOC131632838 n=1 Tax=Vicia villosa TaxID=3911 RepID=UPI00273ABB42|nr:uncharacterized protein LOC131632838 [Vicia villosa]